MKGIKIGVFIILFAVVFGVVFFLLQRANGSGMYINTNQAAVVKQMQSLSRFETASFTIEKIIDAGTNGNAFQQFLFGDKLLLIAHGQVIAGFDFSNFSKNNVDIQGKTITMHLPSPQILTTTLDNSQTRVFDRQTGVLTHGQKDLESQARLAAQQQIQNAACLSGILDQASANARKQVSSLLYALQFTTVTIDIPQGSCK